MTDLPLSDGDDDDEEYDDVGYGHVEALLVHVVFVLRALAGDYT